MKARRLHGRALFEQLVAAREANRISDEELKAAVMKDCEHGVDQNLLEHFYDEYQDKLHWYDKALQFALAVAQEDGCGAWEQHEREMDGYIKCVLGLETLWEPQRVAVFLRLRELRAASKQGPVRVGDQSAASAHDLAESTFQKAAKAWLKCKEIAHKSRTGYYPSTKSACVLFVEGVLPMLAKPNEVLALLDLEYADAKLALGKVQQPMSAQRDDVKNNTTMQAISVTVESPSVYIKTDQASVSSSGEKPKRGGMRLADAEPLVAAHLRQYPKATIAGVADVVGCSGTTVWKTKAWKVNREKMTLAGELQKAPKAVGLVANAITDVGYDERTQTRAHREYIANIDSEIDEEAAEVGQKALEYLKDHPKATREEIGKALDCDMGAVKDRDTLIKELAEEQAKADAQRRVKKMV